MTGHDVPDTEAEFPMRYMMLIHHDEAALAKAPPSLWGDYAAFNEAIAKAGISYQPGNRLQPSSAASTVRVAGDKAAVLDGPYADTKEQLAGYFMIDVPDLDQAIVWATRCPSARYGSIEIRPLHTA
ncbi:YciI family protein [Starkeya sp. ORNL1]|uniref:YciI family protein n=1 Tax=Starkeya sp. ORNL1 TaxID=2709380 RepID=UPI001FEDED40|nr:YciI family protein [Starkeya sp. ORNL1]